MPPSLTAWQRWELADFSEPERAAGRVLTPEPEVAPAPPPPPPQPTAPPEPEVKLPTLDEIEQIMQQAQRDGYQAGYEEGTARVRIEALRVNSLAEQLEESLKALDKEVANELLALALEVARQVIREHLAVKPDAVLAVVKEALTQLPHQSAIIYLHPDDAELVKSHLGEQLSNAGHRIMHDPTMTKGGCAIEAEGTEVDASLEVRWRRVLEGFGAKSDWHADEEAERHDGSH